MPPDVCSSIRAGQTAVTEKAPHINPIRRILGRIGTMIGVTSGGSVDESDGRQVPARAESGKGDSLTSGVLLTREGVVGDRSMPCHTASRRKTQPCKYPERGHILLLRCAIIFDRSEHVRHHVCLPSPLLHGSMWGFPAGP